MYQIYFILEWHSTCFGRYFRPSSGVQDCTYSNQTDIAVCLLASRQQYLFDKCLLQYVQSYTPDDGRKDRPKYVECYSKVNKFDTLVHLVGFTVGIYYDARPYERQTGFFLSKVIHSPSVTYNCSSNGKRYVKFGYFYLGFKFQGEQVDPVGIVTRLRAGLSGARIPTCTRIFLWNRPHRLWGPPRFLFDRYRSSFLRVGGPRREPEPSSPSSSDVKT